jgi:predicted DNA-binding ribbon-helix-helix protein
VTAVHDDASRSNADAGKARDGLRLVKHSLVIAGHRTSISLEDVFWTALRDLAARRGLSIAALVSEIDATRGAANLSSALRVAVLCDAQHRAQPAEGGKT